MIKKFKYLELHWKGSQAINLLK